MYVGLEQQPTFIYSENSNVTEYSVAEAERNKTKRNESRDKKARLKITPQTNMTRGENEDGFLLGLPSSATSIIKRPSTTLIRHSPFQNTKVGHCRENFPEELEDDDQGEAYLSEKSLQTFYRFEENESHQKQIKIIQELSAAKKERDKRTEEEFLHFAKEFAKKCKLRTVDSLLNPVQYDSYLQNVPTNTQIVPRLTRKKSDLVDSKYSSFCSSSLIGRSSEDDCGATGHMIGDLMSFASNMARCSLYLKHFLLFLILADYDVIFE